MKSLRITVLAGGLMLLASCTPFKAKNEVRALNEAQAVGSPFTQFLSVEYRNIANNEYSEMFDYPDALHFARKGLAASAGKTVMPEPIGDWNLLPEHARELGIARGKLISVFERGAREMSPEKAAGAQASFDCWIEQQEENWQAQDINQCKQRFAQLIGDLEMMTAEPPAREPAPIAAQAPMRNEDAMYLVFFDFNKFNLNDSSMNILAAVAREATARNLSVLRVIGHTDRAGPNAYNNKLAVRRANSVRDALTGFGVDPAIISAEGRGEDELLVPTADNVREPANRRAQVTFQ